MFKKCFTQHDLGVIDREIYTLEDIARKKPDDNKLKDTIIMIIKVLNSEKCIIGNQINSTNITQRKRFSNEFYDQEKILYELYQKMPPDTIKSSNLLEYINKHLYNAMSCDFLNLIKFCYKYKIFSPIVFIFFGMLLCMPYFVSIRAMPEISLSDIPISLLAISMMGLYYTGWFIFFYISVCGVIFYFST